MAYVLTGTAGLCIWIILWALNISGFDALLIGIGFILALTALRNIVPYLASRKDS